MADDDPSLCILKVEKFPKALRTRLNVKAAASGGKTFVKDLVARYCQEGLDRDEAEQTRKPRPR